MLFKHDYARTEYLHRIIYIEYIDGFPHSVTTDVDGIAWHFDFEPDCQDIELFMFREVGSGGRITDLQAPHFVRSTNRSYWLHPEAKFKGRSKPKNMVRIDSPIQYTAKSPKLKDCNPFNHGREIYRTDYCKFCEKWYDDDACPAHHVVNERGELEYADGSKCE